MNCACVFAKGFYICKTCLSFLYIAFPGLFCGQDAKPPNALYKVNKAIYMTLFYYDLHPLTLNVFVFTLDQYFSTVFDSKYLILFFKMIRHTTVQKVRNLGVLIDDQLNFSNFVTSVAWSCCFAL